MATVPADWRRPVPSGCRPQWKFLILASAVLVGCNSPPGDAPDGGGEATDRSSPADGATAADTAIVDPGLPVCLQHPAFVANGALPVDPPDDGDAAGVADLRWERHDGCERFVIDLTGADGEPAASAGRLGAEVLRELGVVRVRLRGVESVDPHATDARFDGSLARAAYAVRSPAGGWIYVDLHLGAAAEAGLLVLEEPARVVIDLRPGGGVLPPAPGVDRRVVVLEPRPGSASYPLTVTGYARTFEANVVARLERAGETVEEDFTTATSWADAWGHYTITLPDGPSGQVRLHVGEYSARDGTWEGVAVDLEMR